MLQADFTPLMCAAYHNHPKVVQALTDAQCNVNMRGSVSTVLLSMPPPQKKENQNKETNKRNQRQQQQQQNAFGKLLTGIINTQFYCNERL